MFPSNIAERAIITNIFGKLIHHWLEVEQMPKQEIMTWSHKLQILSVDGYFAESRWLTNPVFLSFGE